MSEIMNREQLNKLDVDKLTAIRAEIEARKTVLIKLKEAGGRVWTKELQDELSGITVYLLDVNDVLGVKSEAPGYVPKPGTENMVHLSLIHGRRFNALTGKEQSKVFNQMFTFSEWQLFKAHYKSLGYIIAAVLHDPYGDAKQFITKIG